MIIILFHLAVISIYSYAFWYDQKYIDIEYPSKEFEFIPLKARVLFFTFWTLALQHVYFVISLLNDFFGTNEVTRKPPLIRQIKDVLFSITLCTAFYVVLVFWTFYIFNKEAIFPPEAELKFPKWINHIMHTSILPIILIELLVTRRNFPTKKTGFTVAITMTAIYAAYIHIVYFKYGIWPYPFLYVVSWTTKTLYFIGSAVLGMVFYLFGEKLDSIVSGKSRTAVSHMNGSKKVH